MLDAPLSALALGVGLWYVVYGLECLMNGAFRGGPLLPFVCRWEEFTWNLPVYGPQARLAFTGGDAKWALQLPGVWHFLLMNIALPFGPALWALTRAN